MKLQTTEKIVLSVLEQYPEARKDDYVLMCLVTEELNPMITILPFNEVMQKHMSVGLPNWESVTRCRRKIQEKRPDLVELETARRRHKKTKEYINYANDT